MKKDPYYVRKLTVGGIELWQDKYGHWSAPPLHEHGMRVGLSDLEQALLAEVLQARGETQVKRSK